jgi:DNA-binding response OmpR family regulator
VLVVLLTAKGQEVDRQKGADAGAHLYLTKPFDPDALLETAERLLGWGERMPPMTVTKPATTGNLALFLGFVEFVAERHDLAAESAQRLKLVVEEAVTNVVQHGYAGREPAN